MNDAVDEPYLERFGELPRSLRVQANGASLHLLEWGDPQAQPVLLVHGMRAHARWFTPVGPALGAGFRALALDLRGHGQSEQTPPYGHVAYADDVVALCDALQLERPILVGHSMGGSVVVRAAASLGQRLHALVLVDAGLGPPPRMALHRPEQRDASPREPMVFETYEQARARFKLRPGDTVASPELLEHLARHAIVQLPGGGFSWRFAPDITQRSSPLRGPLDGTAIRCPVISIWGEHSLILKRVDARDVGERFPSAAWTAAEIIEGAHHHVFLDQPDAFNQRLLAHLAAMRG
jgi:pimeloyl-ACP methyl ester carboxylesterase